MLFQVYFLSLLLEERAAGDLGAVADHCTTKLIRRHPHVFGETEAADAATVLRNWDRIKRDESGGDSDPFGDLPDNLPATIYARKVLRRAAAAGGRPQDGEPLEAVVTAAQRLRSTGPSRDDRFHALGEVMLATVAAAAELGVDPELALRAAANRRREEVGRSSDGPKHQNAQRR